MAKHKDNIYQKATIGLSIALVLLALLFGYASWNYNTRLTELEDKYELAQEKNTKDLADTREAVKRLGAYFEEKGNTAIDGFFATYRRMEQIVEVHDENVAIYNNRILDLDLRVDKIEDYLSR